MILPGLQCLSSVRAINWYFIELQPNFRRSKTIFWSYICNKQSNSIVVFPVIFKIPCNNEMDTSTFRSLSDNQTQYCRPTPLRFSRYIYIYTVPMKIRKNSIRTWIEVTEATKILAHIPHVDPIIIYWEHACLKLVFIKMKTLDCATLHFDHLIRKVQTALWLSHIGLRDLGIWIVFLRLMEI